MASLVPILVGVLQGMAECKQAGNQSCLRLINAQAHNKEPTRHLSNALGKHENPKMPTLALVFLFSLVSVFSTNPCSHEFASLIISLKCPFSGSQRFKLSRVYALEELWNRHVVRKFFRLAFNCLLLTLHSEKLQFFVLAFPTSAHISYPIIKTNK